MKKSYTATMTDMHRHSTKVFKEVDQGHDVLLMNKNNPRYVLMEYQRFVHMLEKIEDLHDIALINESIKSEAETEPLENFLKRFNIE